MIELIVVLTIASLLLAVLIPLPHHRQRTDLRKNATLIAEALRSVRVEALISDRSQILTVDIAHRTYRYASRRFSLPADAQVSILTVKHEVIGNEVASIRFFPDGSSTGGKISIRDGERHYDILIDWLTGGVSVDG